MRNMLALVGALVVGFGGVGWYLGWYKLSVTKSSDGTLQVTTNVDTSRVVKDAGEGARHVGEFIGTQVESAKKDAANTPVTPAGTPGPKAVPTPAESGAWLFGIDFGTPAAKK
ncbi:hypothetical protein [Urbifossiella limnaea]|uniref:Uncharacterized protein n=1 Tax=Urbifossiella limnaea TaxID=2528023 RepID=A0A517XUI0_9BACT|nr:hypothetical protein [Urbifossiella limnaea]QDU21154.1 hypothetical protein ETAA1_31190 [Urbifossiella limnaea]